MISASERFRELADVLGWRPLSRVAMTWAYFDESGLHGEGGHLERFFIGGGIATAENWEKAGQEWEEIRKEFGFNCFHMTDFEKYKGEFKSYTIDKHRHLMNRLLDIQGRYVSRLVCVTNDPKNFGGSVRKVYRRDLVDILRIAGPEFVDDGEMNIMFAAHEDCKYEVILSTFNDLKPKNKFLGSVSIGYPEKTPQLQLADMVIYEMSRATRAGRQERYPFKKMKESAKISILQLAELRAASTTSARFLGSCQ